MKYIVTIELEFEGDEPDKLAANKIMSEVDGMLDACIGDYGLIEYEIGDVQEKPEGK